MAIPEHVQIITAGNDAFVTWRQQHHGIRLDCSGANLSNKTVTALALQNINLNGANLTRTIFSPGVDLTNAELDNAAIHDTDFSAVQLRSVSLAGVDLSKAKLTTATIQNANLRGINLSGHDLTGTTFMSVVLDKADLSKTKLEHAVFQQVQLNEADLSNIERSKARFSYAEAKNCRITDSNFFECGFTGCDFRWSDFTGTSFVQCEFEHTNFEYSDWRNADFYHATIKDGHLTGVKNAHLAKNLLRVRASGTTQNFEDCERPRINKLVDWEQVRIIGRLPFFTVSTTALVLIPLYLYLISIYNAHLSAWKVALESRTQDIPFGTTMQNAFSRLHEVPIPTLSALSLIAAILLLIASSIYIFFAHRE
jgi:uncharacterized protein YjbI with pentapeptide repeats